MGIRLGSHAGRQTEKRSYGSRQRMRRCRRPGPDSQWTPAPAASAEYPHGRTAEGYRKN